MAIRQLSFIEETTEERQSREIEELRISINKMRKGQYAKIGTLQKMYDETWHELQVLKASICKGTV